MPRLPPALFWQARRTLGPQAPGLLAVCRDLTSVDNELRWIREHVAATRSPVPAGIRTWILCDQRKMGAPLQYVIGTQPFGELNIMCRRGVLIPRPETEAYTIHLANKLSANAKQTAPAPLRILDFCTGTGCIALLLFARLQRHCSQLFVQGLDASPTAVSLAQENLGRAVRFGKVSTSICGQEKSISFEQGDLFAPQWTEPSAARWDVLVANPPYVSKEGFAQRTARAVRNWEPREALVPRAPEEMAAKHKLEDVCYPKLLEVARVAGVRRMLFEVGGLEQARRVAGMVLTGLGDANGDTGSWEVEIWRDVPDTGDEDVVSVGEIGGEEVGRVTLRGTGEERSVYAVQR